MVEHISHDYWTKRAAALPFAFLDDRGKIQPQIFLNSNTRDLPFDKFIADVTISKAKGSQKRSNEHPNKTGYIFETLTWPYYAVKSRLGIPFVVSVGTALVLGPLIAPAAGLQAFALLGYSAGAIAFYPIFKKEEDAYRQKIIILPPSTASRETQDFQPGAQKAPSKFEEYLTFPHPKTR